ncbi:MAG: glycine zipper domain-containing protein [Syntrophobacterales bacterium]|nr:glycine zipper domain-containing protein [Syntrophobacterales bacterium]
MWFRKVVSSAVVITFTIVMFGCATTPQGQQEQQAALTGGAIGAVTGGVIGYLVGGEKGAAIGALAGAALGALSAWAIEKRNQAMREAALRNKPIVIVKEDKTEKVIAEPVEGGKIEEEGGKKYRKVKVRTYKVDPKTKKEEITSDTIERVPLE